MAAPGYGVWVSPQRYRFYSINSYEKKLVFDPLIDGVECPGFWEPLLVGAGLGLLVGMFMEHSNRGRGLF